MNLMPLDKLGPNELSPGVVQLGLYLPWVSDANGNKLSVMVITEQDQLLQKSQPREFPMQHSTDPTYGDYWTVQITIQPPNPAVPNSTWGSQGTYPLYWYKLYSPLLAEPLDMIGDPFAREFGIGEASAFTLGFQPITWSAGEANWKTPALQDLVVYELHLDEFGSGVDGTISRLPYLADLGVNCIEIMPVTNIDHRLDWGYQPLGHFGVAERFGNQLDFQKLVDAAHGLGLAVILDMVYGHTDEIFTYQRVYDSLRYNQNPVMGAFAQTMGFGASTNFNQTFTQDFFYSVNQYWLDKYHVDGFRYDCVPEYYDGGTGKGDPTWPTALSSWPSKTSPCNIGGGSTGRES